MKFGIVLGTVITAALSFGQSNTFDMHVADYRLLLNKRVQADCGITAAQRDQLNKVGDAQRAKVLPYIEAQHKLGKSDAVIQSDKTYNGYMMDFRGKFLAILSPAQLKRLRELSLQSVDLGGVLDVIVAKKIGMSDAQLTKCRAAYSAGVKQSEAIVMAVGKQIASEYTQTHVKTRQEATALNQRIQAERAAGLKKHEPELHKIEAETKRLITGVLTAKQLAAYRALEGKAFSAK